jgi:uncharacterized protein (DUF2235 family)
MPKNIVICADGTGNTTVKGRGTNVFKLYEAVDEHGHLFDPAKTEQVAIYHDGVGTESLKWLRMFSGALGWGLSRNVKQLYGELSRVYDRGDRIFLFGFSRGAFTVRTLAGLVITCGILDPARYRTNHEFGQAIRDAYGEYRQKYQTTISRLLRGTITVDPAALRQRFSVTIPAFIDPSLKIIDFIGVWDTVDAVGSPFGIANVINSTIYRFKFPDTTLNPNVGHACQALALDEERRGFAPVIWKELPGDAERIEQVWFAGVHSNVGGGYPRQGMSLVTLDWMMRQAEGHGLRFIESAREQYRDGTDVDDKLYDSRAGLGVFYRWGPRNADALCRKNNVVPKVHRTVFQRIARNTEGYAPGSVPPNSEIVTSSSPEIADPLRRLVADAHGDRGPLVEREAAMLRLGSLDYAIFLGTVLLLGFFMLATYLADIRANGGWQARVLAVATTILSTNWLAVGARTLWHHLWLLGGAAIAFVLMLRVDRALDDRYSEFWHPLRGPMRELLERRE